MANGRLRFLEQDEMKRIHETSLKLLENVGVTVNCPSAVNALKEHGARESENGRRILIPEEMVKAALSSAPKEILLAARDPKLDMRIPSTSKTYAACGGEGAFVKDLLTGDSRYATADDVRDFAYLVDRLDEVDFFVMMVGALDQPAHLKHVVELMACLESTRKHIQTMPSTTEVAQRLIRLASEVFGREELEKRPIFSAIQCPISPLTFERGLTESQMEFAKAGIPVVAMVATVAGLTSPVTLSGTLAQVNAENLASLVISQSTRKGAPWVYSSDSSAGDLRTGSIDYGAFETQLIRAGAGQMGRFYGLPTMVAAIGLEAIATSLTSVQEGIPFMIIQALPDSDLASGLGGVDQAAGASFEQLVADAWVWEAAKNFTRTFDFDAAAISYDTLVEGCLDGNYLKKRHTLERFREEFAAVNHPDSVLTSREEKGAKGDLIKKAHKEARRILAQPREPVLSKGEENEMHRMLREWR